MHVHWTVSHKSRVATGMSKDSENSHVHVIDFDTRRRAQLSRDLITRDFHAEIYEGVEEFLGRMPAEGLVLMLDGIEGLSLPEFLERVRNRNRFFPLTAYAEKPQPERIVNALRSGATDYLQWPIESRLLDRSLKRLCAEREQRQEVEIQRASARNLVEQLTGREHDVLFSLVSGNSNKEIAKELGISHRTVEIYRKNIMTKLNARSTPDAVRIAIYAGVWEGLPFASSEHLSRSANRSDSQASKTADANVSEAA